MVIVFCYITGVDEDSAFRQFFPVKCLARPEVGKREDVAIRNTLFAVRAAGCRSIGDQRKIRLNGSTSCNRVTVVYAPDQKLGAMLSLFRAAATWYSMVYLVFNKCQET